MDGTDIEQRKYSLCG